MILTLAATLAIGIAVTFGPLRLGLRAGLRLWGGKAAVTRWQGAATQGFGLGLVAAPPVIGAALGGQAAVIAAVLGLSVLLFVQDIFWRWLPLEWSVPLLALGLVAGFLGDHSAETFAGAVVGGGFLAVLQALFRHLRGVEALGTGDIWLAAGVGAFTGPTTIAWVLALAALSALAVEMLRKTAAKARGRNRWGVAFGSHIIALFLIIWAF